MIKGVNIVIVSERDISLSAYIHAFTVSKVIREEYDLLVGAFICGNLPQEEFQDAVNGNGSLLNDILTLVFTDTLFDSSLSEVRAVIEKELN